MRELPCSLRTPENPAHLSSPRQPQPHHRHADTAQAIWGLYTSLYLSWRWASSRPRQLIPSWVCCRTFIRILEVNILYLPHSHRLVPMISFGSESEREMMSIRHFWSISGVNWTRTSNWNTRSYCNFYGIRCTNTSSPLNPSINVTLLSLTLDQNNLVGGIPASIAQLPIVSEWSRSHRSHFYIADHP